MPIRVPVGRLRDCFQMFSEAPCNGPQNNSFDSYCMQQALRRPVGGDITMAIGCVSLSRGGDSYRRPVTFVNPQLRPIEEPTQRPKLSTQRDWTGMRNIDILATLTNNIFPRNNSSWNIWKIASSVAKKLRIEVYESRR